MDTFCVKLNSTQEIAFEASRVPQTGRLACTFLLRLPFSRCCSGDAVTQTNVAHKEPASNKGSQPDKTLFLVHTVKAKFSETQTAKATRFSGLQTESKATAQEKLRSWKIAETPTYLRTRTNILLVHFVSLWTIPNGFKHAFVYLAHRLKCRLLFEESQSGKRSWGGDYWAQSKYIDPNVSAWRIDATTHCVALL